FVSIFLLIRLLTSYLYLRRLRITARALPLWMEERFRSLAAACGVKRKVRFLSSDKVGMPLATGLFKPAIIFPRALEGSLSESELDQIALHELAHLKRFDDFSVLFQRLAQALFFFHPAVLLISRRLDTERELACDDAVVRFTGITTGYASCLTHLAELTLAPRHVSMAAGAFLTRKRLVRRVERILAGRLHLGAAASRAVVAGALLLLAGALMQFIFTPSVVAIEYPVSDREQNESGLTESDLTKRSGDNQVETSINSAIVPAVYLGPALTGSELLYVPSVISETVITLPNGSVVISHETGDGQASLEKTYRKLLKQLSKQRKFSSRRGQDEFSRSASRWRELESRYQKIYEGAIENTIPGKLARARRQLEREIKQLNQNLNSIKGNTGVAPVTPQMYVIAPNGPTLSPVLYAPPESGYGYQYSYLYDTDNERAYTAPRPSGNFSGPSGSSLSLRSPHPPRAPRASSSSGFDSWSFSSGQTSIRGDFIVDGGDGEITYSWSDRGHRVQMRARGRIVFSEDDDDVIGLSDDGYLIIRERYRGDDREYEVADDGQGGLERVFYRDGRRTEIDDDAREWISKMVLRAIRNTGIGAEQRVERILESGGVDAVVDEIEEIRSGYATRRYYAALMDQSEMNSDQRIRLLEHITREIDSDYERAEILSGIDESWLEDKKTRMAYVEAVGRIDSDYEKRRALTPIIVRKDLSSDLRLALLEIARVIDSDYERAELLGEIARSGLEEGDVIDAYMLALDDIDSDYEKRRVLSFITDRKNLSRKIALAALKMSRSIDSDYERAEFLLDMYRSAEDDDSLLIVYVEAIRDIDSNYEKRRVLDEITSRRTLTEGLALTVLEIAATIDSDYELAELLTHMARFCTGSPKLFEAYVAALSDLDSDYETRRVLERLDIDEETDPALIGHILRVVERMDSGYEKGQILEGLAPFCLDDDELYESFLDAVDSIDSEYERNKLLSIIYDHDRQKRKSKKK
ncbi:MAG: M56 family metallopeptidase, partial [candidate division Zixibacteria bacterium]|nr:M56 family metallopeptidase [candidate division Zixibacteria bacterium]